MCVTLSAFFTYLLSFCKQVCSMMAMTIMKFSYNKVGPYQILLYLQKESSLDSTHGRCYSAPRPRQASR